MAISATHQKAREFPKKLYYKINEVSKITSLKPHVLRYWETEFKELSPLKDENDQRRYRMKDLELIFEIQHLLHEEGFTIKGARNQLKTKKSRRTPDVVDVANLKVKDKKAAAKPAAKSKKPKVTVNQLNKKIGALKKEVTDLYAFLNA